MRRLLITTLIIGGAAGLIVGALHASRTMAGFESVTAQFASDYANATRVVGDKWQYVLIFVVALGVTWLSLRIANRWRSRLLIGLLLVELFGLSWVCSLYRVFFQPAPCVVALLVAWAGAEAWAAFLRRDRSHLSRTLFADRLSKKEFRRLGDATIPFEPQLKPYEVSVVVCDIANKFGFGHDSEAEAFAETTAKFIRETAAHLTREGAYLQASDGEGVVGIFGFPLADANHAEKAVRFVVEAMKNARM